MEQTLTVTLVLRAAGIVQPFVPTTNLAGIFRQKPSLEEKEIGPNSARFNGKTFAQIAQEIAVADFPESIKVEKYPPNPSICYWFIDAIDRLSVELTESWWLNAADWVMREFSHQFSLVCAHFHERMDPIAMAMAACVAERMRRIEKDGKIKKTDSLQGRLPSARELLESLRVLFDKQLPSGIWNKYFPLFHYPGAGSNFCFSFELLEAVLTEFGLGKDSILDEQFFFSHIQQSVDWCEKNRLAYRQGSTIYEGWNSGGQIDALNKGKPESWATAVVHMFLNQVQIVLSDCIERTLLDRYSQVKTKRSWNEVLDSIVELPGGTKTRAKKLIEDYIEAPLLSKKVVRAEIRNKSLDDRRSVLLFGPPGTSKTTLVRAFAKKIDWPCIEITPSRFLSDGLAQIYQQADIVFRDLEDLAGVVVFFDEMDALVQRRNAAEGLDVTRQFLTTSMLPKLAKLHDDGRVIFFMATNHQGLFDPAIKRPGRFDLLICLGPPSWADKLANLSALWTDKELGVDLTAAKKKLDDWTTGNEIVRNQLDRFTVDEIKALLDQIRERKSLLDALNTYQQGAFITLVNEWNANYITLYGDATANDLVQQYEKDLKSSKIQ